MRRLKTERAQADSANMEYMSWIDECQGVVMRSSD